MSPDVKLPPIETLALDIANKINNVHKQQTRVKKLERSVYILIDSIVSLQEGLR